MPHNGTAWAAAWSRNEVIANRPQDGPLIYLNCEGRLDAAIATVETNGGKIAPAAKHQIGPYGFRAVVLDSEGNRIACIRKSNDAL